MDGWDFVENSYNVDEDGSITLQIQLDHDKFSHIKSKIPI